MMKSPSLSSPLSPQASDESLHSKAPREGGHTRACPSRKMMTGALHAVRGPKPIMAPVGGLGGGFGSGALPLLPYPYGSGVGRGRRCLAAAQQVLAVDVSCGYRGARSAVYTHVCCWGRGGGAAPLNARAPGRFLIPSHCGAEGSLR